MRCLLLALACWGLPLHAAPVLPAPPQLPTLAAGLLVLVDGEPLWAHQAQRALPPASLTKLMTALLVAERGGLDDVARVSARAAAAGGTRLGLRAGDATTADALLDAALIRSANDACLALAEWHSGSEARFVARMNARAAELGLARTRFANPCGMDAAGHLSSAADLARLALAVLARPDLALRVRQTEGRLVTAAGRRLSYASTNALLAHYPGALGVKTGHTAKAGDCLVALAERDGHRILVVMLGARDRWWDASTLLDHAFARLADAHVAAPR